MDELGRVRFLLFESLYPVADVEIVIPFKAVTEQLGEYFAYVVGDSNKVNQQRIELGSQIGGNVVVKTGLQPGDKIVVDAAKRTIDWVVDDEEKKRREEDWQQHGKKPLRARRGVLFRYARDVAVSVSVEIALKKTFL